MGKESKKWEARRIQTRSYYSHGFMLIVPIDYSWENPVLELIAQSHKTQTQIPAKEKAFH